MDPRTVRVFLADGIPTGILIAEIMNFSGKVFVVPRPRLGEIGKRPEAKKAGVYFLVGEDPENLDRAVVYVGETDNIYARLTTHKNASVSASPDFPVDDDPIISSESDWWNKVAFVTSSDENLTKAHVRHLESLLIAMARAAGRATIKNTNSPQIENQSLPESDRADMRNFVNQLQLQLSILGFDFLKPSVPLVDKQSTKNDAIKTLGMMATFKLTQAVGSAVGGGITWTQSGRFKVNPPAVPVWA